MKTEYTRAWHITADTLRDGRPLPAIGEWLVHDGPLVLCVSGLHGCARPLDVLSNTPAKARWLHAVTLDGAETWGGKTKLVARRRRIDASYRLEPRSLVRLALEAAYLVWRLVGLSNSSDLNCALYCADSRDFDGAAREAAKAAMAAIAAVDDAVVARDVARAAGAAGDVARAAMAVGAVMAAGDAVMASVASVASMASVAVWASVAAGGAAGDTVEAMLEARATELLTAVNN